MEESFTWWPAYFNDDGVNLMPDFIVSLHSHAVDPSVEPTAYVPRRVKVAIKQFGDLLQKRYADAGLPHRSGGGPEPKEDGEKFPPPSFNLPSALHHACGAVAFVFECPVGVKNEPYARLTHDQILDRFTSITFLTFSK